MSEELTNLFKIYTEHVDSTDELEVKFFTKKDKKISRIDFDNIIKVLKSKGFTSKRPAGVYLLRIQNEFIERKTGRTKMSNIRTEIESLSNIKSYCNLNGFPIPKVPKYVRFYQKRPKFNNGKRVEAVDYDNFNFRVDIKEENHLRPNEIRVSSMLEKWNRSKKNFRFIKRFTFLHPQYPLKVDCSIVKSSKATPHGRLISEYTIQAANVLNNLETYEIEIEVDTPSVLQKKNSSINDTIGKMKKVIRFILGGIQQTNFPIGNDERDKLLKSYMTLLKKK